MTTGEMKERLSFVFIGGEGPGGRITEFEEEERRWGRRERERLMWASSVQGP
jgi:hypothetical protein